MKTIILKPIITEKSISKAVDNKYVFEIHHDANKIEVIKAINNIYKVTAIKVNIVNKKGKVKKFKGKIGGKTKDVKKAIVTVKKGQKIKGFDIKEK